MLPVKHDIELYHLTLLEWWGSGRRTYPWRNNRTTYRTAIAELMLRRTKANQVVAVYEDFLKKYPDLASAASADDESLHEILKPLGLKWRADNIISFLRQAFSQYGSDLPLDREKLLALPGVGDYVSAAIVCFAGEKSAALIDTNVVRVLARLTGREYHAETRREQAMRNLATACVDPVHPAEYHYALLDFGALVCTARSPKCSVCPMNQQSLCLYAKQYSVQFTPDMT